MLYASWGIVPRGREPGLRACRDKGYGAPMQAMNVDPGTHPMISKVAQAAGMILSGATVLAGSLWLISLRPGLVPYGSSQATRFSVSAGYRLLLGVDLLVAAWAVGWIALVVLGRRVVRGAWLSELDTVRPPQLFLASLLLLQLLVVLAHRANSVPPIVFTRSSLKVGLGVYRWSATLVGGNAAGLGFLVACAAVALWYLSGALGCSRHRDVPTPTVMSTHAWAKQVAVGCVEIIAGFALLMFLPVAAESIAREFRPSGWFFWEGDVIPFHLFGFSLSDHHFHFWFGDASWPAWVGLTLALAATSWAFGLVASAVVRRVAGIKSVSARSAEEARFQAAKKVLVWLLGANVVLAVGLPPEELGRFHLASTMTDSGFASWRFSLDFWLGLVALLVVAAAVLHLAGSAFNWWDTRNNPSRMTASPGGARRAPRSG